MGIFTPGLKITAAYTHFFTKHRKTKPNGFLNTCQTLSGLALLGLGTAQAAVNEVFPADYFAPDPGTITLTGYAFHRQLGGPYKNGHEIGDWDFSSDSATLRITSAVKLGGYTVAPILVLSGVHNRVNGSLPGGDTRAVSAGLADPRLGATLWLLNLRQENHYLAVTGMVLPPLGSYHAEDLFNLGENRWRGVAMLGWQRGWTAQWLTELAAEAAWYGDNDDYVGNNRLAQAPSFALTGYLRYKFTPAFHGFLGMQLNTGGATEINGLDQHNPPRNQRLMAGVFYNLGSGLNLNLRYGRDLSVDNGLRTDHELALRLVKTF